jgi:cellulose synthase/poly-beta-1,6-N-acetylglucosamine synthase-like glycosyltransferase
MKLVIQIPCYNEEATIVRTLDDLPKFIPGIDEIKILIIDDGSKDRTVEVAQNWGVRDFVRFNQNKVWRALLKPVWKNRSVSALTLSSIPTLIISIKAVTSPGLFSQFSKKKPRS